MLQETSGDEILGVFRNGLPLTAPGVDRCVVAGWSFGVNTAFELALRHPERVSGLFAVAGVPGGTLTLR